MTRLLFLFATIATTAAILPAQSPPAAAPSTVINDPAWSSSASPINVARARAPATTARLTNVSIRARAATGADTLIAGATVQGTGTLPVLVRAIGPGLGQFGITGFLRDPKLEIYRGAALSAQTNTTGTGATAASSFVGAFPPQERSAINPESDAALVGQASAGSLTAHCSSFSGTGGIALLEFYDASPAPGEATARFVNLSSRARVDSGEGVIVVGFVVAGEGSVTLLLRGVGGSLAQFGVTDFLRDPAIDLYAGKVRIATNDSWNFIAGTDQARLETARVGVGAFALTNTNDAALLVTLPAGSYTLQVRGNGTQSGIALAEIHEVAHADYDVALAINDIGLDLFRAESAAKPGTNLILSPYSIESALALAYAGAAGSTRAEMARVLRLPEDNAALQSSFDGLRRALETVAEDSKSEASDRSRRGTFTEPIQWSVANRLFGQTDYAFRDSFLALMRDGFAAPFEPMDFRNFPEPSRLAINRWVETQTREKITDLLPPGSLTDATRLVLVNALYLKAPWDVPFLKSQTTPLAFRLENGTRPEVPTMQRSGFSGYIRDDGFSVVTLNYLGNGLQFLIALPDEGISVDAIAARITAAHFARWSQLPATNPATVNLYLPKFKIKGATVPLSQSLKALGMRSAFDVPLGSANFDGIAPRRADDYLAISQVFHQTFVAVDEEGTEAAAATAVVISVTSAGPIPILVRVDRPFLFAIQHRASGACLFVGRITDPR